MILDIIGDIPAKEGLILKVNGVEKELNMANKKIRFQLPDNEEHMVYFKQKKRRYRNPAVSLLIFLLTAIIQGFANLLVMNESVAWFRNLHPYLIKGHFSLPEKEHIVIALKYIPSQYLDENETWSKPQLLILESDQTGEQPQWNALETENLLIRYDKDMKQFNYRFGSYIRKVVSTALIWGILFVTLLVAAYLKEIAVAQVVLLILLFGILAVSAFLIVVQHIKKKKLIVNFLKNDTE
jgi:hypothetical protein